MPFNVTPEDSPGLRARARETNAVLNTVNPRPEPPAKKLPVSPKDLVNPKAKYGSRPGEKRIDVTEMAKSLGSYEKGTDYVPKTGPAILHEGEAVTPAKDNPMNPYAKIAESTKKPKKALKEIRVRKAHDGSHIVEHHHHHPAHPMEEHTAKDMEALQAHMQEHVPNMESAQP